MSVGGPHCGWPGSPLIRAYLDKVYGTYAFREVQGEALLQGNLPANTWNSTVSSKTLSNQVLITDAQGRSIKTYANSNGKWAVGGDLTFPVKLTAKGVTTIVPSRPSDGKVLFKPQ